MNSKFAQMLPKQTFKLNLKRFFLFTSLTLAVGASKQTAFASEHKNVLDPSIHEKLSKQTMFKKDTFGIQYLNNLKVKILVVDESRNDNGQLTFNSIINNGEGDGAIYKREIGSPYEIQITNPISIFNDLQKEELNSILNGELKWARPAERRGSVMSLLGWSYFYKQDSNHYDKPHMVLLVSRNNALTSAQQDCINLCLQKKIQYMIISQENREMSMNILNTKIFEAIEGNYFDHRLDTQFKNGEKKGYKEGYNDGKIIASNSNSINTKEAYDKGYQEGRSSVSTSTFESSLKSQASFENGKQQGSKIKEQTLDNMNESYGKDLKEQYNLGFQKGKETCKTTNTDINKMNESYGKDLKEQYRLGYNDGGKDERASQKLAEKLSKE